MTQKLKQQEIKEIARKLFREKGYGGVCLNDIAKDLKAQNLAVESQLKSKENLFDMIIKEQTSILFDNIELILNNAATSLSVKVQQLIHYYFSFMEENERLNLFILREIKTELDRNTETKYGKLLKESVFAKQIQQHLDEFRPDDKVSILDLFIDLTSLCVFPLLISPSVKENDNQEYSISFERHIEERKELILSWFNTILMLCDQVKENTKQVLY